jgi:tetratricopeptide (TPR) repeat protein
MHYGMTPSAQGTLDKRPLVHLLVYAMERRLTGTLAFTDQLGAPIGSLVVVEGWPAKGDLEALFDLPEETAFAYFDLHDALPDVPVERRDPLPFVWRGIVRRPPWPHVHATLARLASTPLRLSAPDVDRFQLDDATLFAVESLRARPMTANDLAATEVIPPGKTQLLLYCLLITKYVATVTTAESLPVPPPSTPSSSSDVSRPTPVARVPLRTRSITKSDVIEERHPAAAPDPRSTTPPPRPAVRPEDDPALAARRKEILERARTVDGQDYFQMLAVARDAATADVQAAYFQLAKTWHPDRLPTALADVKDACSRVFARMSEAHQTLTEPDRRARYMQLMTEGGATPSDQDAIVAVVEAATSFQKAEVFLKRGDMKEAEAHCKRALKLDPKQADYHALMAWLDSMRPEAQNESGTRRQIDILDAAVAMNEKCERAHFYRAMLKKRIGEKAGAYQDFKRSAELNPRNVDAQREVRLYQMRAEKRGGPDSKSVAKDARDARDARDAKDAKEAKEPAKGLFGRLFRK